MDKDLLEYYRSNLLHIRELADEFARDFPKIAGRLEIGSLETRDPFIERMLEGTAFLAARVEKKLDDGFPQLLESILNVQAPSILAPVPSRAVLELGSDSTLTVDSGSEFNAKCSESVTPVRYSAAWKTTVPSLRISQIRYTGRFDEKDAIAGAASVMELSLQIQGGKSLKDSFPEELDLYLHMDASDASELSRLLLCDLIGVGVVDDSGMHMVDKPEVSMPALDSESDLLGTASGQISGVRNLITMVVAPNFLKFIRLRGLRDALVKTNGSSAVLRFYFKRHIPGFVHQLKDDSIKLGCVPVVNLFRKRSSRSFIENSYEVDVFPDRAAVGDYEVWSIEQVEVFDNLNETLCFAYPFFSTGLKKELRYDSGNFFNTRRIRKLFAPLKRSGKRLSGYRQSHTRISLSGQEWLNNREAAAQLSSSLWCTNGELPVYLRKESAVTSNRYKSLSFCRFLTSPSEPQEAMVLSGNKEDWEKLAFLLLNLSSWMDGRGKISVQLLSRIIHVWCSRGSEEIRRLSEGIASVVSQPRMFRFIERGAVFYESGYSVEITLHPEYFEGVGVFTFGSVLASLVKSFTPLNSVTEIILKTPTDGVIAEWKNQED